MAAIAKGQYTGSLAGAMGDYAEWRGIAVSELSSSNASAACAKWSEQVPPDDASIFRAACLALPGCANRYGLRLGARPDSATWEAYCNWRADAARQVADQRSNFVQTCLRFR